MATGRTGRTKVAVMSGMLAILSGWDCAWTTSLMRTNLTSHDIRAINKVYDVPANEHFCWQPDYSSKQYSDPFIDWVVDQVTNDVGFPDVVRGKLWNLQHPE